MLVEPAIRLEARGKVDLPKRPDQRVEARQRLPVRVRSR